MRGRRCFTCKRRIITRKDAADSKKTFTEPVAVPHCDSPTCDYCQGCVQTKWAEIKARSGGSV